MIAIAVVAIIVIAGVWYFATRTGPEPEPEPEPTTLRFGIKVEPISNDPQVTTSTIGGGLSQGTHNSLVLISYDHDTDQIEYLPGLAESW
jgi:ABC-type transport system substrate-binding protein